MRSARASLVLSGLSLLVTLASFVSQLIIARAFGASREFDTYLAAMSLPSLATGLFGGLFVYAMVPALTRAAVERDPGRTAGAFLVSMLALAFGVAALGVVVAPLTVRLLGAGVRNAQTVAIARVAWLGVGASIVLGYATALLNVQRRFTAPVLVSILPYAGMITAVLAVPHPAPIVVSFGLTSGTLFGALALLVLARRHIALRTIERSDFEPARTFSLGAPLALMSVLTFSAYSAIDAFWAPALGPASLSVLGYCQRLLIAIAAIMATGPSIILQPRLSAAAATGDLAAFDRDLWRGIRLVALVCVPAVIGISLLSGPLIRLAFERGAFDRSATLGVARLLPWMLAGMVPMIVTVLFFKALYARDDVRTALYLGILGPSLYFVGSGLLSRTLGISGIGLAYCITWTVVAIVGVARVMVDPRTVAGGLSLLARDLGVLIVSVTVPVLVLRAVLFGAWGTMGVVTLATRLLAVGFVAATAHLATAVLFLRIDDIRALVRSALPHRTPTESPPAAGLNS
jgi:putative peptidoglycan lipid II flippase